MELAEVGRAVRDARTGKGLTQAALASRVGVSRATVNALETGTARELGFGKVDAILREVGLALSPTRIKASPGSRQVSSPRGTSRIQAASIRTMARKYLWWQTPDEALRTPDRIIAQVMDLGTIDDLRALSVAVGRKEMARVLKVAAPGWFRPRSFAFWCSALRHEIGPVPPTFPQRRRDVLPEPV